MRERAASYDGSWSSLQKPKPVKTKTGLTTLDGVTVGTLTREQWIAARAEDAARIHVVQHQRQNTGDAA